MKNITDIIEEYLKNILANSDEGYIEIQRSQLACEFNCVPSQINYVIATRFTLEKGYLVESKRGGGGFIRIRKLHPQSGQDLFRDCIRIIGEEITQSSAEDIIERLYGEELITARERELMRAVVSRKVLHFDIPVRDRLRASLLRAMIASLLCNPGGGE